MKFEFRYTNNFGVRYYPINKHAEMLLKLMKHKVLTEKQFEMLKDLGWPVQIVKEEKDGK